MFSFTQPKRVIIDKIIDREKVSFSESSVSQIYFE